MVCGDVDHVPVLPGFAIELLSLSREEQRKGDEGSWFIGRFSLTRVSAEQTEHASHQHIATERIGYTGGFRWSHREFRASRNIIDEP